MLEDRLKVGIEAAKKLGAELDFYTVARKGSAYRESALEPMKNPSATALRNEWRSGRVSLEEYMPSQAIEAYERAFDNGEITDNSLLERAYLMFFRLSRSEDLSGIAEAEGGIADRLCDRCGIYDRVQKYRGRSVWCN